MLRVTDREEDGWEVAKCFLSDDLVYNSENKKQLSRARREAAAKKKKREASKQKLKKKKLGNVPLLPEKNPRSLANHTKDTAALVITQKLTKSVFPTGKNGIFNMSAQTEETETTIIRTVVGKSQTKLGTFQYMRD